LLASVPAPYVKDNDDWVINGQKVWTSNAHISHFGLLLARSDPTAQKHKVMTMFWVDIKTPGIEVRPIHQISGNSGFNEVFFTDVRIPDSQRTSEVSGGWKAALPTLATERLAIGGAIGADYEELIDLALKTPSGDQSAMQDAVFRQKLVDW